MISPLNELPDIDELRRRRESFFTEQSAVSSNQPLSVGRIDTEDPSRNIPCNNTRNQLDLQDASTAIVSNVESNQVESAFIEKPSLVLKVHRSNLRQEMISLFSGSSASDSAKIQFEVYDVRGNLEDGVGAGVNRDVFSAFWKEVSDSLLIGEMQRVPYVRHDLFKPEWEAIGKILLKGYADSKYFPLILSSAFVMYTVFGDVPDDVLLTSFMLYVAPDECAILKEAMSSYETIDEEELIDVLDRYKCRKAVKAQNVKAVLLELARQELIQKPHIMASVMAPYMKELMKYSPFSSIDSLRSFYDEMKPTAKRVIQLFRSSPQTEQETESLKFLQRYVRGLDQSTLEKLLRFLSGSDMITVSEIEVTFTRLEGTGRRPIAHTCAPLLDLPATYENFCELREEFQAILSSGEWQFDTI